MSRIWIVSRAAVVAAVIAVVAACATESTPRGDTPADEAAVKAATAVWVDAYNSRKPERIAAMYASDAVFWGTTSKTIRSTPGDIAEYFKDAAKRPDARVAVGEQHVRVFGDVGVNSGVYTFSDVRDGQPTARPARFSMAFHRREGRWVLVDHHSSEVR